MTDHEVIVKTIREFDWLDYGIVEVIDIPAEDGDFAIDLADQILEALHCAGTARVTAAAKEWALRQHPRES